MVLCISSLSGVTQHDRTIRTLSGRIYDIDGQSVPFVNICLKSDRSIGTYSNSSGSFTLKIVKHLASDSIVVTCIGYETRYLSIGEFQPGDSVAITLQPASYWLSEITIRTDTAVRIVRESLKRFPKTLASQKNITQGFYREIVRSYKTFDRLVEAAVDVFDYGYQHRTKRPREFRIRELRRSEDYMDLDWRAALFNYIRPINGLHGSGFESLFSHDYIYENHAKFVDALNAPLNAAFLEFVSCSLDGVTTLDGEQVIRIRLEKNPDYAFPGLEPSGYLYIRSGDLALLQMEYSLKAPGSEDSGFFVPEDDFIHKTIIKYRDYNGALYLSFLYRKSFRLQGNISKTNKGFFYDEKLFVATEILTEKDKVARFRRKEKQDRNVDLYSEQWNYNEEFWKSYNVVNETALQPRVRSDLERESSLESQFKKND